MKLLALTEKIDAVKRALNDLGWEEGHEYARDQHGFIVPGHEPPSEIYVPKSWTRFPGSWGHWPHTRFVIESDKFKSFEGSPTLMNGLFCKNFAGASLRGIGKVKGEMKLVYASVTSLTGFQHADELYLIGCYLITNLTGLEHASIWKLHIDDCGINTLEGAPSKLGILWLESLHNLKTVRLLKTSFTEVPRIDAPSSLLSSSGAGPHPLVVDHGVVVCLSPYLLITPGLTSIVSSGTVGRSDILKLFNEWLTKPKSKATVLKFQQHLMDDPHLEFLAEL